MKQTTGELKSKATIGVTILILFSVAASAVYFLYHPGLYGHIACGVVVAWGFAVTFAIYVRSLVIDGHMPADGTCAKAPENSAAILYARLYPQMKALGKDSGFKASRWCHLGTAVLQLPNKLPTPHPRSNPVYC